MTSSLARLFRTTEEELTPVEGIVSGDWPDWLEGSLLRVGPAVFDLNNTESKTPFTLNHWCDGYSTLLKFTIHNGKVSFIKRYLKSEAFEKARRNGKPVMTEFGTRAYSDPTKSFLARALSNILPDVTDNCSGNIIKLGSSYFATTDTANMRVIYPDDLSTGEKVDMYKLLGVHIVCSHTVRDHNGDSYALATSLVTGLKYNVIRIPDNNNSTVQALKDAKVLCSISSRWKTCVSYYHSFALTDKYIVFIEQPYIMNGMKLLSSQVKGKSMKDCLEWTPDQMNRFYVIEKTTGKILPIKYRSKDPFFLFHHVNAFEDNNEIILDVIGHDSPEIVDKMFIDHLRNSQFCVTHKSEARRFVIPIIDSIKNVSEGVNIVKRPGQCEGMRRGDFIEVTPQPICSPAFEMPTINRNYFGKKYKYFYATGLYDSSPYQYSVVKVDVDEGLVKKWFAGEGQVPSEAMFLEKPDAVSEDDGILLVSITTSQPEDTDRLVLLDASNMEQIGVATFPCHIPTTLHGIFIKEL